MNAPLLEGNPCCNSPHSAMSPILNILVRLRSPRHFVCLSATVCVCLNACLRVSVYVCADLRRRGSETGGGIHELFWAVLIWTR